MKTAHHMGERADAKAHARHQFISDDDGGQQIFAGAAEVLTDCKRCGYHDGSRMQERLVMHIVELESMTCGAVDHCRGTCGCAQCRPDDG